MIVLMAVLFCVAAKEIAKKKRQNKRTVFFIFPP
jgi:hypothetical protein